MALVQFSAYVHEVAPHVEGCPSPVITQYIRKTFTDLCERAKVWRTDLSGIPLVAGTDAYVLTSPVSGTEVCSLLQAQMTTATNPSRQPLEITTYEDVVAKYSFWPDPTIDGYPLSVYRDSPSEFNVVPVPDNLDTYTVYIKAAIRPTLTAATVEDTLMSEFRRVWFHGTIHELMLMPNKKWSNEKLAAYHGKQWEFFLNGARAKSNKGFSTAPIYVQQQPWA